MNDIIIKQNLIDNLYKLAAQRNLYSSAKKLMAIQLICNVPIVILLSLILLLNESVSNLIHLEKSALITIKNTYIILLCFLDLFVINKQISQIKEKAAIIQESFDCKILSLPCNEITTTLPPEEEILENARDYQKIEPDLNSLKNWYSVNDKLPLPVARIICQRSNCYWDKYLREKFNNILLFTSIIMLIVLIIISLIDNFSASNIIQNVFLPVLPFFIFTIRHIQDHNKSVDNLNNLRKNLNNMWERILCAPKGDNELLTFSRAIQDELLKHRKTTPLVPDWFYRKYKYSQQQSVDYSSEKMSNDYTNRTLKS